MSLSLGGDVFPPQLPGSVGGWRILLSTHKKILYPVSAYRIQKSISGPFHMSLSLGGDVFPPQLRGSVEGGRWLSRPALAHASGTAAVADF